MVVIIINMEWFSYILTIIWWEVRNKTCSRQNFHRTLQ